MREAAFDRGYKLICHTLDPGFNTSFYKALSLFGLTVALSNLSGSNVAFAYLHAAHRGCVHIALELKHNIKQDLLFVLDRHIMACIHRMLK